MRNRAISGAGVAVAILLPMASVFAQIVKPSQVVPPLPQKLTVSGTLTTVGPNEVQRQQIEHTSSEVHGPAPATSAIVATPEAALISLRQSAPSAPQSLDMEEVTPWLSTPSVNWFTLGPKDAPQSWQPRSLLKDASFDQPAKGATTSWEQKPTAAFDTPPVSPSPNWDDRRDPKLKGTKVDWK